MCTSLAEHVTAYGAVGLHGRASVERPSASHVAGHTLISGRVVFVYNFIHHHNMVA